MKVLYCPICQKPIQECECGDGCDVCGVRKALYALQVCGQCVELPRGRRPEMIKPTLADYLRELSDDLTVMLRDLVRWADESGVSGDVWDRANKLLADVEGEGWKEMCDGRAL